MPSTSTAPPTTVRPSSGNAGQITAVGRPPAVHADNAPRTCPAIEPRIVESIFMNSRSTPRADSRRTALAVRSAACAAAAARTPVATAITAGRSPDSFILLS